MMMMMTDDVIVVIIVIITVIILLFYYYYLLVLSHLVKTQISQSCMLPLFNAEYLRNVMTYSHSYNELLKWTYALLKGVISNDFK